MARRAQHLRCSLALTRALRARRARPPEVAEKGLFSCFAAARAACVSTWLGEDAPLGASSYVREANERTTSWITIFRIITLRSRCGAREAMKVGCKPTTDNTNSNSPGARPLREARVVASLVARLCLAPCRARSARRGSEAAAPQ